MAEISNGGEIYEIVEIGKKSSWHKKEKFFKRKRVRLKEINKIPKFRNSYGAFGVKFRKSFGFADKNGHIWHFDRDFYFFSSHIKLEKV